MENEEVVQLYLDDIIPNRFQPREVFNDQALKELAISIREHGVIQPILVRKFGDKYEIIAGERRYKASTMAGLTKIPAIVKNLDDKESSKVALIENLQRRDLTPIEEARTYQKILDLDEMTQEDLAKTMGKSQSAVSNKLRLLSLPDEIQESLLKGEISERHARSLLNVSDRNVQVELLKEIINNRMTVRELDARIKNMSNTDQSSDFENTANGTDDLFGEQKIDDVKNNSSNQVESLFGDNTVDIKEGNNNSLFGMNENSTDSMNSGVDNNMNDNSLFGSSNINPDTNLQQDSMPIPDNMNNISKDFNNDQTIVDISKIREQSMDINPEEPKQNKTAADINSLLMGNEQKNSSNNRFIPMEEKTNEPDHSHDEPIGNGLLAGMPVIKPVDDMSNSSMENNSSFASPVTNDNFSNFNPVNDNKNEMDGNNLFTPPVIDNISTNNLVSSIDNNSNGNNSNLQLAVADVKNIVNSYQDKGYNVTVEELNLDNEIQLIVKFNKN